MKPAFANSVLRLPKSPMIDKLEGDRSDISASIPTPRNEAQESVTHELFATGTEKLFSASLVAGLADLSNQLIDTLVFLRHIRCERSVLNSPRNSLYKLYIYTRYYLDTYQEFRYLSGLPPDTNLRTRCPTLPAYL
jgi:hypothetical protein